MGKYRKQWNRKFENVACAFMGMEDNKQGIILLFNSVPASALQTLGEELMNFRFCEDVEVRHGSITMLEPDRLFFCEDELKEVMREVLDEMGFDLHFLNGNN